MRLIHQAGPCDNGPCPNVFAVDGDPDTLAVQGTELVDAEALGQLPLKPDHETLVLVPRALIVEYAQSMGWRPPA